MRPGIQANCSAISSSTLTIPLAVTLFQRHSRIKENAAAVNDRGEIKIRLGTRTKAPTLKLTTSLAHPFISFECFLRTGPGSQSANHR